MYFQRAYVDRGYFATIGLLIGGSQLEEMLSTWFVIPDEVKLIKAAVSAYIGAVIGGVTTPIRVMLNMYAVSKLELRLIKRNIFCPTADDLTQYEIGFAVAVVLHSLTPPTVVNYLFRLFASKYSEPTTK